MIEQQPVINEVKSPRHSREGGNPASHVYAKRVLLPRRRLALDSRLRGNDAARLLSTFALLSLIALSGCVDPYAPTPHPDYTIRVIPTASGGVAVPPACPSWSGNVSDPFDNQPVPQFGCATARNLAAMVERPDDLIEGRPMGNARGVTAVGAIRRYDNDQTRGLIVPGTEVNQPAATTSSSGTSALSGDITGASASTSSASTTSSP